MSELRSPIKRRKLDHADSKIPEQINSLENLRSSLFFRQTSSSEVKQGQGCILYGSGKLTS